MTLWLLLSTLVMAQSTSEEEQWVDDQGYEIIVRWGQAEVRQSRAAVTRRLEELGYEQVRTNNRGEMVFRPPKDWMGRLFLSRDGLVRFGRPVLGMFPGEEAVQNVGTSAIDSTPGYADGVGVKFWVLPSERKLVPIRARVVGLIEPELLAYRQVLSDTAFMERRERLPVDLDALWTDGVALEGTEVLDTPEARRAAVLAYWASRPDTREGRVVARDVEVWLENTVMPSEHPVTEAERVAAEEQAVHGRRLGLHPE